MYSAKAREYFLSALMHCFKEIRKNEEENHECKRSNQKTA